MNADGSDERKLLAANAWSPAWSPDGATIAFVSDQDGDDEIYTVDGDGQNTMKLTDNQGIADDAPSWSPDSTMIAFTSNRAGDGNIFSMRTNGSGVHTLVGGVWTNSDPAWRP
jgi:TolB protein